MTELKLAFDPEKLDSNPDGFSLYLLFSVGGVALRFWGLFKKNHITDQHFVSGLLALHREIKKRELQGDAPYDLDWFIRTAAQNISNSGSRVDFSAWIVKHWDYFNPRIQRKVTFVYERLEPVEKRLSV